MNGLITVKEEWLYPDSELVQLTGRVEVHVARNGCEAVKVLLEAECNDTVVSVRHAEGFHTELFRMVDVFVGYNEAETEEQDGMFVITQKDYEKPSYCSRKAPFRVYEVLEPLNGALSSRDNRFALCMTIRPRPDTKPEKYLLSLDVGGYSVQVEVRVYDVVIPEETLRISNWFNVDSIRKQHHLTYGTPEFFSMVRQYARAMRRLRQTHFFMHMDDPQMISCSAEGIYDFSRLKVLADLFFEEGFQVLEFGSIGTKYDDLFTDEIKCALKPALTLSSDEGYALNLNFIRQFGAFLTQNGWTERTVIHVLDEPDVHVRSEEILEKRKLQYMRVVSLLRKYIPGCRVIEAVKSSAFKGGVDIWVPLTATYEAERETFGQMAAAGDDVWVYVCCVPTGHHLNRFLDIDLIKSRLLFWGCSAYQLSGYLHWGLNWIPDDFNPYENSNTPNTPFNGIYPAGDAFIIYPGSDGPRMGMRFEAQRRGAEDFELLKLLRGRNPELCETLTGEVFRSFTEYNADPERFEEVRKRLLTELEKTTA